MDELVIRIHGIAIHDEESQISVIGDGSLVDTVVDDKKFLTSLFVNGGRNMSIIGGTVHIGRDRFVLSEYNIIPIVNLTHVSLLLLGKVRDTLSGSIPVLPYYDVVYRRPALAVPVWFYNQFMSVCGDCLNV